jgi:hypothetical protein
MYNYAIASFAKSANKKHFDLQEGGATHFARN